MTKKSSLKNISLGLSKGLTSVALFAASTIPALAQDGAAGVSGPTGAQTGTAQSSRDLSQNPDQKFWLFGGIEGGFAGLSTDFPFESSKSGFTFGARGVGSYYTDSWIFDLSLGWVYSRIESTSGNPTFTITTRSGDLQFNPRYRLDEHWSIGPSLDLYFGADNSYAQIIDTSSVAAMVGATAYYEFIPSDRYRVRLLGQFLTDLSISDRQYYAGIVGLQIGLPISGKSSEQKEEPAPAPIVAPQAIEEAPPAKKKTKEIVEIEETSTLIRKKPSLEIVLEDEVIHFETNSDRLTKDSEAFLREFGRFLADNGDAWTEMRVEGHADRRGAFKYNMKLSKRRAASVANALIIGGAPTSRLSSQGYGPTRPIDPRNNDVAWSKNRRVELQFYGMVSPDKINSEIRALRDKYPPQSVLVQRAAVSRKGKRSKASSSLHRRSHAAKSSIRKSSSISRSSGAAKRHKSCQCCPPDSNTCSKDSI